jgi:hypothetical protein
MQSSPERVTGYLLVRQSRSDKSGFLEKGGYTPTNPDTLISGLIALSEQGEATPVDDNQFGRYHEIAGVLRGPSGLGLRVRTIWMTEHL